jgi:hypothetical protein
MAKFYILNENGQPEEASVLTWSVWCAHNGTKRLLKETVIQGSRVNTVFLGYDPSYSIVSSHRPKLFETWVFGGKLDGKSEKYCTRQEAEEGHEKMVEAVKKANPKKQSIHE